MAAGIIYREGDDHAFFEGPAMDRMEEERGQCFDPEGEPTEVPTWLGYGILIKDPRYRRAWHE